MPALPAQPGMRQAGSGGLYPCYPLSQVGSRQGQVGCTCATRFLLKTYYFLKIFKIVCLFIRGDPVVLDKTLYGQYFAFSQIYLNFP